MADTTTTAASAEKVVETTVAEPKAAAPSVVATPKAPTREEHGKAVYAKLQAEAQAKYDGWESMKAQEAAAAKPKRERGPDGKFLPAAVVEAAGAAAYKPAGAEPSSTHQTSAATLSTEDREKAITVLRKAQWTSDEIATLSDDALAAKAARFGKSQADIAAQITKAREARAELDALKAAKKSEPVPATKPVEPVDLKAKLKNVFETLGDDAGNELLQVLQDTTSPLVSELATLREQVRKGTESTDAMSVTAALKAAQEKLSKDIPQLAIQSNYAKIVQSANRMLLEEGAYEDVPMEDRLEEALRDASHAHFGRQIREQIASERSAIAQAKAQGSPTLPTTRNDAPAGKRDLKHEGYQLLAQGLTPAQVRAQLYGKPS